MSVIGLAAQTLRRMRRYNVPQYYIRCNRTKINITQTNLGRPTWTDDEALQAIRQ